MEDNTETHPIQFKSSKRKKVYRQRIETEDETTPEISTSVQPILSPPDDNPIEDYDDNGDNDDEHSVSTILRARRQRRQRLGGIAFVAVANTSIQPPSTSMIAERDVLDPEDIHAAGPTNRFAKQSGMVGDVNKHMMAYIDSELARQRQAGESKTTNSGENASRYSQEVMVPPKEAVTHGKIQEIDLGDESRNRNAIMTEDARRRAAGEAVKEAVEVKRPVKVRLGPDGKPWRGRGRKRRASDDIKRDSIVDQLLRENKIEMYEEVPAPRPQTISDGQNDDRIAEEFRREFLESQTQRKKPVGPPASGGVIKGGDDVLKGPKLGGSRSMRAKMHAELLKTQQSQKK